MVPCIIRANLTAHCKPYFLSFSPHSSPTAKSLNIYTIAFSCYTRPFTSSPYPLQAYDP